MTPDTKTIEAFRHALVDERVARASYRKIIEAFAPLFVRS